MKNSLIITSLTILMMSSALQAMDVAIVGQSNLNERLVHAATWGNVQLVQQLITAGADVNAKGLHGTALIQAARHDERAVCEFLIAHGADINATEKGSGRTALMIAASIGLIDMCKLLIAHGAEINATDDKGVTALIWAATMSSLDTYKFTDMCKLLVKAMIKLTGQERTEVSTLLSLKKKSVAGLHSESKKLIASTRLDDIKREKKQNAREQIMRIPDEKMKQELLDYLNSIK